MKCLRSKNLYAWVCDGIAAALIIYGIVHAIVAHAHH